jgi:tetratricopeptide (TPR) repeat protein
MAAVRENIRRRDQQWRPTLPGAAPSRPALAYQVAPPEPQKTVARRRRVRLLRGAYFIAAASAIGGSASTALLFYLLQGPRTAAPPALVAAAPRVTVRPAQTSSLSWSSRHAELNLRLLTPDGRLVAESRQPVAGITLRPGPYVLEMADESGEWSIRAGRVTAVAGAPLRVVPPLAALSRYYLWKGKQAHERQQLDAAERWWARAIDSDPDSGGSTSVEARLQLAGLLAVRFRYSEARRHVTAVLGFDPENDRALQLLKVLDRLEDRP